MKTVLITGGTRGIGLCMVRLFSELGYRVGFCYHRSHDKAREIVAQLNQKGGGAAFCCDLENDDSVDALISEINKTLGGIDILINNAGVSSYGLFQNFPKEELDRVLNTNLRSALRLTQALIPSMIQNSWGRVINVSSVWGETGGSCEVLYSAAKAALIGFTKALAKELAPSGVTVNCISPGVVDTDMMARFSKDEIDLIQEEIPCGRMAKPEEIAQAALFLSSENASYITGQVLGINGGMYC